MLSYIKAIVAFIQIFLTAVGFLPMNTAVNYGGTPRAAHAVASPMALVKNGGTGCVIVVPDGADACTATAAKELRDYVERRTDAALPVTAESAFSGGKAVVLGETALTPTAATAETVEADGFRWYADGERFFIRGGSPRGTLYGVYAFLEDYCGVRWYAPDVEKVPQSPDLTVDGALDKVINPSFSVRRNDCAGTNDAYRARTRMNVSFWYDMEDYGGALTYVLWDVTLTDLVPDALFAEHPDYFALQPDGTRSTDHVCLSHPEVLPVAVENARKAIQTCERSAKYLHVGQKDNENYCHCPTCEALYEQYGTVCAPTILFTNALAQALEGEFPDFTFTFYAYNETDRPPTKGDLRCRDNVAPVLCELHKACRSHPLTECGAVDGDDSFLNLYGETEPTVAADFVRWTEVADTTYIYDYTINFLNTAQFFSNLETLQPTMKYMHDIGITGYIYNCGDGHYAAFNELRNYLYRKVQWDVDADVSYHMDDFLAGYYGEAAAPYLREILDLMTACARETSHHFDFDWYYQAGFVPPLTVTKLDRLWDAALKADITDDERFRVETAHLSWEYYKANLLIGRYAAVNPLRMKENEKLYDDFAAHNVGRVSSFKTIPPKEEVDFLRSPYSWGTDK